MQSAQELATKLESLTKEDMIKVIEQDRKLIGYELLSALVKSGVITHSTIKELLC